MGQNCENKEQAAAIIMQRKLRPVVDTMKEVLDSKDYDMLCLGVERLASEGSSAFDETYERWMNSRST
jgi:hypothetical protein